MPSIQDVAARAGVSAASVTRVLNGHPNVSDSMRSRVLKVVEELRYRPDLIAAALRRGRTKTVGIIISDIMNPIHSEIIDRLEHELSVDGYSVILANSHGAADRDAENVRLLSQRRIDALIVMCADERSTELQNEVSGLRIPVLLFDRQLPGCERVSSILGDHREGTRQLVGDLLDSGHRQIALLLGSRAATFPVRERLAGFELAHSERGLEMHENLIMIPSATPESGEEAVAAMARESTFPTAIVVGTNTCLTGVLREMHKRSIRIGQDVAIACLSDLEMLEIHQPQITTLARKFDVMAHRGAALLSDLVETNNASPRMVTIPLEVLERESTRMRVPVQTAF